MIVKCIDIYNIFTKEYLDGSTDNYVVKGNHYNVLEINFDKHGIFYRLIVDHGGLYAHSFLARAQDFEIISAKMPNNWVLCNVGETSSDLTPPDFRNLDFFQTMMLS